MTHTVTTTVANGVASIACTCGTAISIPGDDLESDPVAQAQGWMAAHAANPVS